MGAVASACYKAGGRVHGVIPKAMVPAERSLASQRQGFPAELLNPRPSNEAQPDDRSLVTVVDSMHTRKRTM